MLWLAGESGRLRWLRRLAKARTVTLDLAGQWSDTLANSRQRRENHDTLVRMRFY